MSDQVTYHSKLNRPSSQCEESEDYKYSDCLNRKIASLVGCQTFSTNFPGIAECSTYEQYTNFSSVYEHFNNLEKNDLQAQSGCLRPCKYLEYRVTFQNIFLKTFQLSLQLADTPITTSYGGENITLLNVVFASSSVLMEKEEEAFSFESLVADVGGVLGLFIGFNFLEILQFFIVFGRNSLTELFKKKKFNRNILNISQEQV